MVSRVISMKVISDLFIIFHVGWLPFTWNDHFRLIPKSVAFSCCCFVLFWSYFINIVFSSSISSSVISWLAGMDCVSVGSILCDVKSASLQRGLCDDIILTVECVWIRRKGWRWRLTSTMRDLFLFFFLCWMKIEFNYNFGSYQLWRWRAMFHHRWLDF